MEDKNSEIKILTRKEYYTNKIKDFLDKYPSEYKDFVKNGEILTLADELLSKEFSTGCNIATFEEFPVNSTDSLIFYGVYKQRAEHFGKLLATMEQRKIIEEADVAFGVRATKVLGDWPDEECIKGEIKTVKGGLKETRESVEAVLIFHSTPKKTEKIIEFLVGEAPRLEGGYEIPDVRTTATEELKKLLIDEDSFKLAKANVFSFGNVQLTTLTPETIGEFVDKDVDAFESLLNPELYEFISVAKS